MKKYLLLIIYVFYTSFNIVIAQDTTEYKNPKDGWVVLPFPYVTFDSDLGYEIGMVCPTYNYGDGSKYPNYRDGINFSASVFTKGSAFIFAAYESKYLIPKVKTFVDFAFIPDLKYDFYGYNAYETNYNKDWIDPNSSNYKTSVFYKYYRQLIRARFSLEGKTKIKNFDWFLGSEYYNVKIFNVPVDYFNRNKSDDKKIPSLQEQPTLYNKYVEWGIIPENEANGGYFIKTKAGFIYDSRDNKANAMKGLWDDLIFIYTPNIFSSINRGSLQLSFVHRNYITLLPKKVSFVYRLGFLGTIAGYTPTYAQTFTFDSGINGVYNEGYGGAKTLRGILRNKVVGDDLVFANFETRWKVFKFKLIKQNLYLSLSAFYDIAKITDNIDISTAINNSGISESDKNEYFSLGSQGFNSGVGGGIHIAVNENAIIAFDYGVALDKRDGNNGIYIGAYFLF
jgi:hypothetical protein